MASTQVSSLFRSLAILLLYLAPTVRLEAQEHESSYLVLLQRGIESELQRNHQSAIYWFQQALAEARRIDPGNLMGLAATEGRLASSLLLAERCSEAEQVASDALGDADRAPAAQVRAAGSDLEVIYYTARYALAGAKHCLGDYRGEERTLRAALQESQSRFGHQITAAHPSELSLTLAELLLQQAPRREEAKAILISLVGENRPRLEDRQIMMDALERLWRVYREDSDNAAAARTWNRLQQLTEEGVYGRSRNQ